MSSHTGVNQRQPERHNRHRALGPEDIFRQHSTAGRARYLRRDGQSHVREQGIYLFIFFIYIYMVGLFRTVLSADVCIVAYLLKKSHSHDLKTAAVPFDTSQSIIILLSSDVIFVLLFFPESNI